MLAQLSRRSIVALLVVAFVALVGCQNTPMQPTGQNDNVQLLKANAAIMGLAKGDLPESSYVAAEDGATLGGTDMNGNYVVIPANTLNRDMDMTFKIYIDENGVLVFQVHADDVAITDNIYFQDGQTATLAVNKAWLAGNPDIAMNLNSNEKFSVQDGGDVWLVDLPHFSNWCWAIAG